MAVSRLVVVERLVLHAREDEMSRSENTPWKGRRRQGDWIHAERKDIWLDWGLPRGHGRAERRLFWKSARARATSALAHQQQPEPVRTRSSVKYDYW